MVALSGLPGLDGDDGGDEGAAQPPRDRLAHDAQHVVVLPGREVRAVLLDPAGQDQRGGGAVTQRVPDLEHGELLDPHVVERVDGAGELHHVVHLSALGGGPSGGDGLGNGGAKCAEGQCEWEQRIFSHEEPPGRYGS